MGLFLKGIGLTMDESLRFWKSEFIKKNDIDSEKFEENYSYNIRHSYGQEGKRNDYKPWNCNKTIEESKESFCELLYEFHVTYLVICIHLFRD